MLAKIRRQQNTEPRDGNRYAQTTKPSEAAVLVLNQCLEAVVKGVREKELKQNLGQSSDVGREHQLYGAATDRIWW